MPTTHYVMRASLIAPLVKNLPVIQETLFNSWVGKILWRRESNPGESHGQRSLAGYSPWDHKSWTRLSD